jgi:diguanylate cyclase (GGDEF)-like protein/PAS domain S-box-containing protein
VETLLSQALPALAGSLAPGGAAADLLRALTEHTPVGVFLSDASGECRFVNGRWCELTGLGPEQAIGDGWAAALHPDDADRVRLEWIQASSEMRDSIISYRFRRPNGSVVWIDGYASAFHDRQGRLAGWIGSCLDVTTHRRTETELRGQAHTDTLTGLPNRRGFEELLDLALSDVARGREPAGLILVDLDYFKRVNDTLGHLAGDQVLANVAKTMRARLGPRDIAARIGGDEFAVIARTHTPQILAAQLLEAIRNEDLVGGRRLSITASAGTAIADSTANDPRALLETADHALYRAKQHGRNRAESGSFHIAA